MMLLALFAILMNSDVTVPKSHWTLIAVKVAEPRTLVDCLYEVKSGSTIGAMLITRQDAERFHAGKSIRPFVVSGFQNEAHFRYEISEPGDYVLVLDNRLEGRTDAKVHLRLDLTLLNAIHPVTVPPGRQVVIIALSVLFFVGVVTYSIRQYRPRPPRAPDVYNLDF